MRLTCYRPSCSHRGLSPRSACGGSGDPLGGPYGGTGNTIPPNGGNLTSGTLDRTQAPSTMPDRLPQRQGLDGR